MPSSAADERAPTPSLQKAIFWIQPSGKEFIQMLTKKHVINLSFTSELQESESTAGRPCEEEQPSMCSIRSPTGGFWLHGLCRKYTLTEQTRRLKPATWLHFIGEVAVCWISWASVFRFTDSEPPAAKRTWRSFVVVSLSSITEGGGQQQDCLYRLNHSRAVKRCLGEAGMKQENKWIQSRPIHSEC